MGFMLLQKEKQKNKTNTPTHQCISCSRRETCPQSLRSFIKNLSLFVNAHTNGLSSRGVIFPSLIKRFSHQSSFFDCKRTRTNCRWIAEGYFFNRRSSTNSFRLFYIDVLWFDGCLLFIFLHAQEPWKFTSCCGNVTVYLAWNGLLRWISNKCVCSILNHSFITSKLWKVIRFVGHKFM